MDLQGKSVPKCEHAKSKLLKLHCKNHYSSLPECQQIEEPKVCSTYLLDFPMEWVGDFL